MISFITGNKNKFAEVQAILPGVQYLNIDLPELQELDPKKIIEAKLQEARKQHVGELIVEDTSLSLVCLNGMPGPLIKWFMQAIGNEGLIQLAERFENDRAEARTMIGYVDQNGVISYFEGVVTGRIVRREGVSGFGWDPVFLPDGYEKTFAEMTADEKNMVSMRRVAVERLAESLKKTVA